MADFNDELAGCIADLEDARRGLLATIDSLSDADLERGRRGGWTLRRVIEHLIHSEWLYGRLVVHLRGRPAEAAMPDSSPASVSNARDKLDASREALLAALDGVDEGAFYAMQKIGHEE
jgi:hypothetical protein